MANKGKKKGKGGTPDKAVAKKSAEAEREVDEREDDDAEAGHDDAGEAAAARAEDAAEEKPHAKADKAHGEKAHGHGAHGGAHGHKPNVKEYLVIFVVLALLTALEVGVAQIPGISKKLMVVALIGLALAKAGIVAMYYMHLKHETKALKMTVAIPIATPALYALVLISEAAWRLTR